MYISKIILENFKGFNGIHELNLSEGMNFFVGNNNCGKTTIFKAIEFIQSAKNKDEFITKGKESENVSVTLELRGTNLKEIIENEKLNLKKYQNYIIDNYDGTFSIKILRSSHITSNTSKKGSYLDIKSVRVYNPNSKEIGINCYENPTGIDKTISALFDTQFVYSDLKNDEYQDFGKTKIVGKIINEVTKDFQKEIDDNGNRTVWGDFRDAHSKAFGEEGLLKILNKLECSITNILKDQYGECAVKFNFGLPEIDNFFKTGCILLSDNGISTPVYEKGTGMQRALALSLIQLYANINRDHNSINEKPIIFFIDEPETFLHPKAQSKLLLSLNKLSKNSQIFITTHSPYLLKLFDSSIHRLNIFEKDNDSNKIHSEDMLNIFGKNSPSWGEINYFAFGIPSIEFHNELYGLLQAKAIGESQKNYYEKEFDKWLNNWEIPQDRSYIRLNKDGTKQTEEKTLPTLIRNIIHHPENPNNSYTTDELRNSIENLLKIINSTRI